MEYLKLGGAAITLPPPSDSHLGKLLRERYSCRTFEKRVIPARTLGTLLWSANGLTRQGQLPGGTMCINRTIPSAGGLYPLEIYALVQRAEAIPDGLYHYGVWDHTLEPVSQGASFQDFRDALVAYPFVRDANAVFLITAIFLRTQHKYGPRGCRYILLETGHAAQNICLAATEGGLASLCVGGYFDSKLNTALNLEPTGAGVVYVLGVGYPSAEAHACAGTPANSGVPNADMIFDLIRRKSCSSAAGDHPQDAESRNQAGQPAHPAPYPHVDPALETRTVGRSSARLGHADPNVTARIYSHTLPADDRRAADVWDSIVGAWDPVGDT